VTVATDDTPSWKLFEHGLLVFERPPEASGPHRLLVCRADFCSERECSCREVRLSAVGLELGADAATQLTQETFRALLDAGPPMRASISIDSAFVAPEAYDGRTSLPDEWVEYLESEVDGELLDIFQTRWLAAKGWRARTWQEINWPTQDSNEMVAWRELHPDDRRDLYSLNGGLFAATELYCPNPACTCTEARVEFTELLEDDDLRSVGSVRLQLPAVEALERQSPAGDSPLLDDLWSAFRHRHRHVGARLSTRRQRVMDIGKARAAAQVAAPAKSKARVGRNDPCPCGSGKKHKQCCLGLPSPGQHS
jgi:hypothetical protein